MTAGGEENAGKIAEIPISEGSELGWNCRRKAARTPEGVRCTAASAQAHAVMMDTPLTLSSPFS